MGETPQTAISVRLAETKDAETVGALLRLIDRHYHPGEPSLDLAVYTALARRTTVEREGTRFALCLDGTRAAGLACFAILRPGNALKGALFLKDIFVVDALRGRGIGRQLMAFVARYARDNDIGRIDLTTERHNEAAQRFYERLQGARQDKVYYRFDSSLYDGLIGDELPD